MNPARYDVREVDAPARWVAGVRAQVRLGQVAREFSRYLDQVYAAARAGHLKVDGQNIFVHRARNGDEVTVDFCVGTAAPFEPVGTVTSLATPSGPAAMTTHHGDYGRIGEANAAILAWCNAHGRRPAGPSWEVYGHWAPDPAKLVTEIYYLLEPGDGGS